jgi:hypothetical protein
VIRIAVTPEAYDAIEATLPGAVMRPVEKSASGKVFVWLDRATVNRLERLRQRGEDLSDVIVRLAAERRAP